ncbi:MAG: RrF2 family transcriptional regulator [Phycisphaerae bacterium]
MLSLTSKYAMRAVICLTQLADESPVSGKCIAERASIPPKYLSKILGDLVRCGVLVSTRGKKGGFRLARPPTKISLHDVLAPFEAALVTPRTCPFGNMTCSDENPCLGHDEWKKVLERYTTFLSRTSIHHVAVSKRVRPGRGPAKRRSKTK